MPQKKNPDILELIRGKTGRVYGSLTSLLTLLKGQPLAYNRDLQEDKAALFDADRQVASSLSALTGLISTCSFNVDEMEAACSEGYPDATALAEYLVKKGVPFRRAHEMVGEIVKDAAERGAELAELDLEDLRRHCRMVDEDVYEVLGARNCIRAYASPGSTAPGEVHRQIGDWKSRLGMD
jgi:argininosuccinate lyase